MGPPHRSAAAVLLTLACAACEASQSSLATTDASADASADGSRDATGDVADATDPFLGKSCVLDDDCTVPASASWTSDVCCYPTSEACGGSGRCMAVRVPRCAHGFNVCGCDGVIKYDNGDCKCPDGYSATAHDHSRPMGGQPGDPCDAGAQDG